ncbi:MAG: MFS transporter [Deltaproteobacteria bacterium]|nr:MFS transporter [Deltaproteobacteria bacterium]
MTGLRGPRAAVAGSALAIFWPGAMTFGFPGVMAAHWARTFEASQGAVGQIIFFLLAAVGSFMFLTGRWQERLGPRRMMTIGALATGLNVLIAAAASNMLMIYLWAFINGAASCFVYLPALTTVQLWHPGRRGLVSGLVNMAFAAAAAVVAPLLSFLLTAVGYSATCLIAAGAALLTGLLAAPLTGLPPAERRSQPEPPAGPGPGVPASLPLAQGLRSRNFWLLWSAWVFQGAAGVAMITLSTAFGLARGFELKEAVIILTAYNLTSGLSRLATGLLSDIIGRSLTIGLASLAAGLAYLCLPHVTSLAFMAVLAGAVGLGIGTMFSVSAPLASDCFGPKHFGAIFGAVFTGYGFLSGLLGPALGGHILDATQGDFTLVFTYLGFFCLATSVLIAFIRPPGRER